MEYHTNVVTIKRTYVSVIVLITLVLPAYVEAANIDINVRNNDASCDGSLTFDQQTVTITAGDTLTFKVPKDDPYSAGLKVQGSFPDGDFVVKPDESHTTQPIDVDISYYVSLADRPECIKGSGSVVVTGTRSTPPVTTPTDTAPLGTVRPESGAKTPTPTQRTELPTATKTSTPNAGQPRDKNTGAFVIASIALLVLIAIASFLWYYLKIRPKKLAVLPWVAESIQPTTSEPEQPEPRIVAPPIPLTSTKPTINPTSAPPLPVSSQSLSSDANPKAVVAQQQTNVIASDSLTGRGDNRQQPRLQ